jgi:hypothetical protein
MSGIVEQNVSSDGVILSQCSNCKNLNRGTVTCKAFPSRIPDEILTNEHNHKKPYPGDNGVRFEKLK